MTGFQLGWSKTGWSTFVNFIYAFVKVNPVPQVTHRILTGVYSDNSFWQNSDIKTARNIDFGRDSDSSSL